MLVDIVEQIGIPADLEFFGYFVALIFVCFVLVNISSLLFAIFKSLGGWK